MLQHLNLLFLSLIIPLCPLSAPNLAASVAPAASEESLDETFCGPNVITIGDAWEFIMLERQRAALLVSSGDLNEWPQRISALAAHARFIEAKAYFLFGRTEQKMKQAVAALQAARLDSSALALSNQREALSAEWASLEIRLDQIAALLPEDILIPTSQLAHLLPPSFSSTTLSLTEELKLEVGVEQIVRFHAERWLKKGRPPLLSEQLMPMHGELMHAFITDLSLMDYQHLHPQPTEQEGVYELRFTPKVEGHYRMWVNQVPLETGREEFPHLDLRKPVSYPIVDEKDRQISLTATSHGVQVRLSFPDAGKGLQPDRLYLGRLDFADSKGRPIDDLEPFMGAYAHIVVLAEDFFTIQHLHPHGPAPSAGQLGGPVVEFPWKPLLPNWWKLWVQVQRKGQIITLPLGIRVAWP